MRVVHVCGAPQKLCEGHTLPNGATFGEKRIWVTKIFVENALQLLSTSATQIAKKNNSQRGGWRLSKKGKKQKYFLVPVVRCSREAASWKWRRSLVTHVTVSTRCCRQAQCAEYRRCSSSHHSSCLQQVKTPVVLFFFDGDMTP